MKKLLCSLVLLISSFNVLYPQAVSKYINVPIKVDGNLTDWDFAEWYWIKPQDPNWKDSAKFALFWDENYLYIGFEVFNSNLQAQKTERDEQDIHMDDGVEVLIDPNLDRSLDWRDDDFAYHVNIYNAILDDRGLNEEGKFNNDLKVNWNGDIISAVRTYGTINEAIDKDWGYTVEMSISWNEIGYLPYAGKKFGADFCVNDRDDSTGKYRHYDWMKLKKFHMPSDFGIVTLVIE
ncbi:MAG: CBM9 family sugar-binding protein [Bacteroidetes bacterium]|nr:CBM9 family sugar-binding protein [Bacteroidota bacterium]